MGPRTAGARELPLLDEGGGVAAAGATPAALTDGRAPSSGSGARVRSGPTCEFNYEPPVLRPLPPVLQWISDRVFFIFLVTVFAGTPLALLVSYFHYSDHDSYLLFLPCQSEWKDLFKYCSIPLVSIIFTWWHVWLGIQMCFYPVEFIGCFKPYLGWQGIVPRRAHIMASRACDIMIGRLITVEEIIDRIQPQAFFDELQPVLSQTSAVVLSRLAMVHCRQIWEGLPESVQEELRGKVEEESQLMFDPVIKDLKERIHELVDFKQMAIDVLCEDRKLLVELFLRIGRKEFVFIQHISAVMGCVLGVIQMCLWILLNASGDGDCSGSDKHAFRCWGGYLILPVSGLIIGYFTNWLGITMIFRPVEPRIVCNGYVNIQGVFLARQQEVSKELAVTICKHLVHAKRILEYVAKRDDVIEKVLGIYQKHMNSAVDSVLSKLPAPARVVLPIFVGREAIRGVKESAIRFTMEEINKHSDEIEAFMDKAFDLPDTMAYRLARLQPRVFEGMLHPVFQEDEWMVLLLGGVLGVVVGLCQAAALGS